MTQLAYEPTLFKEGSILGPVKGVIPTPDTGSFFKPKLDIEVKIKSTLDILVFSSEILNPTLDIHILKSTLDIAKFSKSTSNTLTPFMGPNFDRELDI